MGGGHVSPELPRGLRLGPYVIDSLLGAGGMGQVYRAHDERLRRPVAIKILPAVFASDPDRMRRFEQEARLAGSLSHPNIMVVHDVGRLDNRPFIVEELLEGETLREHMRGRLLSPERAVEIARGMAEGLAAAHAKGIVHRDLKPSNVFLSRSGRVKILDFGLAKLRAPQTLDGEPETGSTTQGLLGTVGYLAPEQARGEHADHRADIFSLGCVFFEMLTGRRPFAGSSVAEELAGTLTRDPPSISRVCPEVPPSLSRIVGRCMEKRPESRFQSAEDLAFALETLIETRFSTAGPGGVDVLFGGPRALVAAARRRWRQVVLLGAWLGVLIAAIWVVGRRAPRETPDWRPLQLTADEGCESAPALSPDGHTVAYVSDNSGNEDLWLIDVDGGGSAQLTDDPASDRSPAWLPDGGALVFVSGRSGEDALWKVPRLGGSAVLLLPGATDPAVSPDGTRIAFARRSPSGYLRIFVAPLSDLSQLTALTDAEGGLWDHQRPAWSPDGRSICYSDFRDLWVVPAAGGPPRRLTFAHAFDRDPVWSSTGRSVLFSSMRGGTRALWRIRADGRSPTRLTLGTGPEAQPSVSTDGAQMAYSTFRNDGDIVLVDLETRERRTVSTLWTETGPAFAPDRGRVVFSSDRSGDYELWVQDLDRAGRPRSMARRLTDLDGSEAVPAFSPDGAYLAFGRVRGEQRDIWVIPSAGGTAWQFTTDPSVDMHPSWSPDGSRLAFVSDRSGRHHVWVGAISAGRAAGPVRQLTTGEASDSFPAWSPDGDSIAFLRVTEEGSDVWLMSTEGGPPRRLTVDSGTLGLHWIEAGGTLLVAGTWGTGDVSLRRVDASTGAVTPFEPRLVLGGLGRDIAGDFDASRDGRFVVFTEEKRQGNIWLLEAEEGSF